MSNRLKKIFAIICLSVFFSTSVVPIALFSTPPQIAHAQGVESKSDWDFHTIFDYLRKSVLNHLATLFAKQILHQLTAEVVNWINSGFKGSPLFLSNPEGFFLDVADQTTGAFLDKSKGPLNGLCNGSNIDLTIVLGIGQGGDNKKRYTCTLGSIFNNVKNTTVNGKSLKSYLNGDFSQGGWNGFIQLTQYPQNNASGAYLQSHSNLLALIDDKKESYNKQLAQGHGFLSSETCTDVTTDDDGVVNVQKTSNYGGMYQTATTSTSYDPGSEPSGLKQGHNCTVTTPGSVIASKLTKNLDVPETELELANDVNSVISALMTQMVRQIMSAGLSSASGNPSSGQSSITNQIINDVTSKQKQADLQAGLTIDTTGVLSYKAAYDQAVSILQDSQTRYATARACFVNKASIVSSTNTTLTALENAFSKNEIAGIDLIVTSKLNTQLTNMLNSQADASSTLIQIQNTNNDVTDSQSLDALQAQIPAIEQGIKTSAQANANATINSKTTTQNGTTQTTYANSSTAGGTAASDLQTSQAAVTNYNTDAAQYQNECDNMEAYVVSFCPVSSVNTTDPYAICRTPTHTQVVKF